MKDILITGANGYLGSRLSLLLAQSNYNITALCYPVIPEDNKWISLMSNVIVGDLTGSCTIEELEQYDFNSIIHLVSLDHKQSNTTSDIVSKVNVQLV